MAYDLPPRSGLPSSWGNTRSPPHFHGVDGNTDFPSTWEQIDERIFEQNDPKSQNPYRGYHPSPWQNEDKDHSLKHAHHHQLRTNDSNMRNRGNEYGERRTNINRDPHSSAIQKERAARPPQQSNRGNPRGRDIRYDDHPGQQQYQGVRIDRNAAAVGPERSYGQRSYGTVPDDDSSWEGRGDRLPRYMNGHTRRFSNDNFRSHHQGDNEGRHNYDLNNQHDADDAYGNASAYSTPYAESTEPEVEPHGRYAGSYPSERGTYSTEIEQRRKHVNIERDFQKDAGSNGPISVQTGSHYANFAPFKPYTSPPADNFDHYDEEPRNRDPGAYGHLAYAKSRKNGALLPKGPDNTSDPGLIPVEIQSFQEPGAVSGYYGTSETAPSSIKKQPLSRNGSPNPPWGSEDANGPLNLDNSYQNRFRFDESRGSGHTAKPLASNFDTVERRWATNGSPLGAEDEMPNFENRSISDVRSHVTTGHVNAQTYASSVKEHRQADARTDQQVGEYARHNEHHFAQDIPRSRSQPDFSREQPSRMDSYNGFADKDPQHAPFKRPATSAGGRGPRQQQYRNPADQYRSPGPKQFGLRDEVNESDTIENNFIPKLQDINRPTDRHRENSRNAQRPPHPFGSPAFGSQKSPAEPTMLLNQYGSSPAQTGKQTQQRMPQPRHDRTAQPRDREQPFTRHRQANLSLDKPLPNPDALPHHPAPIRPALHAGQFPGPEKRPMPVRQYPSNTSSANQNPPSQTKDNQRSMHQVTPMELEQLRQDTLRKPNDSATQFLLAQKFLEAAEVIVDEQADPNTRRRKREGYQSDALKLIKKLSALSYADADFLYADCYSQGRLGLQPDVKEAFVLYQKAAKANHPQAAYRVAVCCELGQEEGGGTKRDAVKAMQWYRRAATLGDVAAKYKMGVILLKGLLGQPQNPQEGLAWLNKAAKEANSEHPHAVHELALLHEKPTALTGLRQDERYALCLFEQAADLGYKFSQFRLGCAYEYGLLGCTLDPRQSIAWYSKAAVQEEHQSELALSGWYLTGAEGILQQSDTEAYLWARKAARAGLAKAEYAMGYFTEVGIGAPANLEDAKRWYWKSASQNFPKARDRLEDLRRGGGPKQKTRVSRTNIRKQSDGDCIIM